MSTIDVSSRFVAAEEINVSVIDGEAAALNVQTGSYFGLNQVGTFIWERYAEGKSLGEVVEALCERFPVDAQTASRDVQAFTRKVVELGLLRQQDS